MAEIKSTLDLVMEKTRHLRLSSEEREKQKTHTFKKKLSGLLQQYESGEQDMDRFGKAFIRLESRVDIPGKKILIAEILDRIMLEQPSSRLTDLLKEFCRVDSQKLAAIIEEYRAESEAAADKRAEQIKAALAKNRHISGDAVIPNLGVDSKWHSEIQSIRTKFNRRLDLGKTLLKSSEE